MTTTQMNKKHKHPNPESNCRKTLILLKTKIQSDANKLKNGANTEKQVSGYNTFFFMSFVFDLWIKFKEKQTFFSIRRIFMYYDN